MRIALYQPEIAGNVGTILRTAACMDVGVDIIGPCGFPFDLRKIKRYAMDYIEHVDFAYHNSFVDFIKSIRNHSQKIDEQAPRLILLSAKAKRVYTDFSFQQNDILLAGRESSGVPDEVAEACDSQLLIPMKSEMRSLNVAISVAIVLGEALRQTR